MAVDNTHDIRILNGLLAATLGSADGCREVAEASEDPGHRALFQARERDRRDVVDQLRAAVEGMGGEPDPGGSILAKAQRAVQDLKHALRPDGRSGPGEVESGETALLGKFDRALEDTGVSATTCETIRRARASVARGPEAVSGLQAGERKADPGPVPT